MATKTEAPPSKMRMEYSLEGDDAFTAFTFEAWAKATGYDPSTRRYRHQIMREAFERLAEAF